MKRPILTIVVPVYNSMNYLENCFDNLEKMLGNQKNNIEVLFINDGSTDDSLSLLHAKSDMEEVYKVIDKPHTGVSDTRNYGIKIAQGKYITFIDSDDAYQENFIVCFLSEIRNDPDIVWNDVLNLPNNYFQRILTNDTRLSLMKMVLGISEQKIQEGIASKFYKTSFLRENELFFNSKVVITEDTLFILQAISKASSIYLSPNQFYYILEEHSLNRFNSKTLEGELELRRQMSFLLNSYSESRSKKLIDDRIKINGFCTLIYRYYGPLIENKKISIDDCVTSLETIAKKYQYNTSFSNKDVDHTYTIRYKLLRILLKNEHYSAAIKLDLLFDKLKKQTWE